MFSIIVRRNKNTRQLLAAVLLMIAVFELGSHALFHSPGSSETKASTWCLPFHYTNPEIDCPHKRDHRAPDKNVFDEMSHLAVLLKTEEPDLEGIVYRSQLPTPPDVRPLSRELSPPFQPPKQA